VSGSKLLEAEEHSSPLKREKDTSRHRKWLMSIASVPCCLQHNNTSLKSRPFLLFAVQALVKLSCDIM